VILSSSGYIRVCAIVAFAAGFSVTSPLAGAEEGGSLSVIVFPITVENAGVTGATLVSLQNFLEARLAAEGVLDVVSGDKARESLDDGEFDSCAARKCRILIGKQMSVDSFVETSISGVDGGCRISVALREVRTGSVLSSGSASTECAPARLKAALKGVARMLGDQAAGEGWVVDQSDIRDAGEGDADGTKKSEKKKVDEPPRPLAWVEIAGGSFDMGRAVRGPDGDSQVSSRVAVPGFRMSETEVTNGQYLACVKAGACTAPHWDDLTCYMWIEGRWRTGYLPNESRVNNFPVACIDRKQAESFAAWAGGRLPTEQEWEYAARGGGLVRPFPWGDARPNCDLAVMTDPSTGCERDKPRKVCSVAVGNSTAGLCDMAGNVWEMVAAVDSGRQVLRGGSWRTGSERITTTGRGFIGCGYRDSDVGFRVVQDIVK